MGGNRYFVAGGVFFLRKVGPRRSSVYNTRSFEHVVKETAVQGFEQLYHQNGC